jgi:hypothetical protein
MNIALIAALIVCGTAKAEAPVPAKNPEWKITVAEGKNGSELQTYQFNGEKLHLTLKDKDWNCDATSSPGKNPSASVSCVYNSNVIVTLPLACRPGKADVASVGLDSQPGGDLVTMTATCLEPEPPKVEAPKAAAPKPKHKKKKKKK